jgi:hypothetical protein
MKGLMEGISDLAIKHTELKMKYLEAVELIDELEALIKYLDMKGGLGLDIHEMLRLRIKMIKEFKEKGVENDGNSGI